MYFVYIRGIQGIELYVEKKDPQSAEINWDGER